MKGPGKEITRKKKEPQRKEKVKSDGQEREIDRKIDREREREREREGESERETERQAERVSM